MALEEFFNRSNILDLSFFNFRNAITACYYADQDLRIQRTNANFSKFFPRLGNVANAPFLSVLEQLGVEAEHIDSFTSQLEADGHVFIPKIPIRVDGTDKVFSLMSTYTQDPSFSYLNGVQGQFLDRTAEWDLRKERERLLEEKLRDRELIEDKTRQLERLAGRLAKYLSPQIYDTIFAGKSETRDPLARKNLTIFFSDIEGFTDISDSMEPERLSFFMNTYLSEMSNIALQYGGTIDKFIGDAILLFFGDPETEGDRNDALRCTLMAVRMRERVKELESVWHENGISKPLKVRMGINTGFCTVGNFGSDHRLEYTVLGGPVNLASRLQTAAEADTILISEATHVLIEDLADCVRMPDLIVKGFTRPVATFKLNAVKDDDQAAVQRMTRIGRHVAVDIPDTRHIREAIEELRSIQGDLEKHLPKE